MAYRYYYRKAPELGSQDSQPDDYTEREVWWVGQDIPDLPYRLMGYGWVEYDDPLDVTDVLKYELYPAHPVQRALLVFFLDAGRDYDRAAGYVNQYLAQPESDLQAGAGEDDLAEMALTLKAAGIDAVDSRLAPVGSS